MLLNDPGRLLSVHIHHTSLVSGWAGGMAVYERMIVDFTDPIFQPILEARLLCIPIHVKNWNG